jgi:hypothetical protein
MADVTDDFSGTALGSSWTVTGGSLVVSGGVVAGDGGFGATIYSGASFHGDQYAEATFGSVTLGGANFAGVILRADANALTGNCYLFSLQVGTTAIWLIENGAWTQLSAGAGAAWNDGDVMRAEATGTSLVLRRNGVFERSVTNAVHSSGRPGFTVDNSTFTSFLAGPTASVGSPHYYYAQL